MNIKITPIIISDKNGKLSYEIDMNQIIKIIRSKNSPCNWCSPRNSMPEVKKGKGCFDCLRFNNYNPRDKSAPGGSK